MGADERRLFRIAVRVGALLFLIAAVIAGQPYEGARPFWLVIGLGVVAVVLERAHLLARRTGGSPPGARISQWLIRRANTVKRLAGGLAANLRTVRRRQRVRRVEEAAVNAAATNPLLAPDSVRPAAEALFRLVQLAWDARDCGRLATLVAPELLAVWERNLLQLEASGGRGHSEIVGEVQVEYVGFANPDGAAAALVVVLIEAQRRAYIENGRGCRIDGETERVCQYWTLGRRDDLWTLLGSEDRAQGKHHLAEPIGAALRPTW
jgi:hypothetical protein